MNFFSILDNGGIKPRTAHTCARRQRAKRAAKTVFGERSEPLADSFWRAKRTARRQTFGERSEFWEKKFHERSKPLAVFFFFFQTRRNPPSEMSQISSRGGDGNFPPSLPWKNNQKCQRTLYVYPVNNPDIIPQKIFPCGAIAKKKHTQKIYIISTYVNPSIIY